MFLSIERRRLRSCESLSWSPAFGRERAPRTTPNPVSCFAACTQVAWYSPRSVLSPSAMVSPSSGVVLERVALSWTRDRLHDGLPPPVEAARDTEDRPAHGTGRRGLQPPPRARRIVRPAVALWADGRDPVAVERAAGLAGLLRSAVAVPAREADGHHAVEAHRHHRAGARVPVLGGAGCGKLLVEVLAPLAVLGLRVRASQAHHAGQRVHLLIVGVAEALRDRAADAAGLGHRDHERQLGDEPAHGCGHVGALAARALDRPRD